MLRTVGPQGSLFELLLPAGMRVLSGELAEIDVLLDDERYFVPFRSSVALQPGGGATVDPDRNVFAPDVLEVPVRARVRTVVCARD